MSFTDDMLELWRAQNFVNHNLSDSVDQIHAEIAEMRDDLLALANRLESVTRAVRGGLHSVKS